MKNLVVLCNRYLSCGHRVKSSLLMLALLHTGVLCLAQQDTKSYFQNFDSQSGSAFAFSKIDNVPMSPFSGQVSLNLPFYEKQLPALPKFSMSLNHTGGGGLKVNTPRTIVGKAWMLNIGGAIIRHKRGVPDDFVNARTYAGSVPSKYNGILYNGGANVQFKPDGEQTIAYNDMAFSYAEGTADAQHDIFEFHFFGRSGKFYLGKNGPVQVVTDSKIKIVPTYDTTVPEFSIGSFLLTDESGVKYYFSSIELAKEGNLTTIEEDNIKYYGKDYPSTWLLTRVEAPFNEDFIQYNYLHSTDYTSTSGPVLAGYILNGQMRLMVRYQQVINLPMSKTCFRPT
jgi:hypothetical protein